MLAYEDNFGFWEIHGWEEQEFLTTYSAKAYSSPVSVVNIRSGSLGRRPSALLAHVRSNMERQFR
jgi:hypothetical protein